MPTPTERRIVQARHSSKRGDILVPILEKVMEEEASTGPTTPEDFRFMEMVIKARALPRTKGVFSPSMLGSCVRQAYFAKRGETKVLSRSPQTNGYFLHGNFIHLKWQFALWRAHTMGLLELVPVPIEHELEMLRKMFQSGDDNHSDRDYVEWSDSLDFYSDGTRPAIEVRVGTEDFLGTIDGMPRIGKSIYVVDFKGINVIDFQRTMKNGAKQEYRKQLAGYGWNVNQSDLPYTIEDCLLVSECKAGPISAAGASPIALHETLVPIDKFLPEVKRRLKTLRWYDSRDEVPMPECVATTHMRFQECPFSGKCLAEVADIQRERQRTAAKSKRDWQVARPSR